MIYEARNFDNLLGLKGFSDQLLKNHFMLYQGYVANANKPTDNPELKRRFGWEFNGMRLHEYYFGNMAKEAPVLDKNSGFFKKLTEDFGTYENWEKDFKSVGTMRGIGWAVLYFDTIMNKLINVWINEHDAGHLSGAIPLLVMDVFEHAYMTDYGLKRAEYIEAFFKVINWPAVIDRFNKGSK
ncbi:MAG: Fe-Mn family superoxide dismutase [Candidatus Omnitrophota bacterium]